LIWFGENKKIRKGKETMKTIIERWKEAKQEYCSALGEALQVVNETMRQFETETGQYLRQVTPEQCMLWIQRWEDSRE
jgi:hypothetical protein